MEIRILSKADKYWDKTIDLAENCSWGAGPNLGRRMRKNEFEDFECPFVAIEDDKVVGFCLITKTDLIPDCVYAPWISFVFVAENYRGNRISQKMIKNVLEYAKEKEIDKVYISTEEENFYEKYGFKQIDILKSYANTMETIFVYDLK